MKLTDVLAAAREFNTPIRRASFPATVLTVTRTHFYISSDEETHSYALTIEDVEASDWEYEKRTWEGKAPRKKAGDE